MLFDNPEDEIPRKIGKYPGEKRKIIGRAKTGVRKAEKSSKVVLVKEIGQVRKLIEIYSDITLAETVGDEEKHKKNGETEIWIHF